MKEFAPTNFHFKTQHLPFQPIRCRVITNRNLSFQLFSCSLFHVRKFFFSHQASWSCSYIINAIVNAIIKAIIIDIMEEFDCTFCTQIVTFRQEAPLCGGCDRWQHRRCHTGVDRATYGQAVRTDQGRVSRGQL